MTVHYHRADANRRLAAAQSWVTEYRPQTPDETAARADEHRRKAASILARAADVDEPRRPEDMTETRAERVAAHAEYIGGGWRDHYRAIAAHRRERSLAEHAALRETMRAEGQDAILGAEDRAYLDTLAHDLAYAEYHIAQLEAAAAGVASGPLVDWYGPRLAHLLDIGVDAARVETEEQIAQLRARLRSACTRIRERAAR